MNDRVYVPNDCIKMVKRIYPFIPKWIIKRVMFANDIYMHKVGIINWDPIKDNSWFTK